MKLVVGLGNPGSKYETTRHNAGFLFLDLLSDRYHIDWVGQKFSSEFGKGSVAGIDCILLKPQTFMNLSGRAVREAAQFYKLSGNDIIVIHDDIDLASRRVKKRFGGGHGGHNGIRSIISELGHGDFARIKLGIGKPSGPQDVTSWVLGRFSDEELSDLASEMFEDAFKRLEEELKKG